MVITSLENNKVKTWSKLQEKKYRNEYGMFLIEGEHLVDLALEKNLVIDLITTDDIYDFENKYVVTNEVMRKISNQVTISKVAATVKIFEENIVSGNAVVLDNLQDPGNLGTIIRSAVAFGFKNVILGNGTVDLYNDKVIRATEGMIFNINFKKLDLQHNVSYLKELGFKVVGTNIEFGKNIKDFKSDKLAFIIGNEGSGMNKDIVCDDYVFINMDSSCESLNAGVAASILMYEVFNGK